MKTLATFVGFVVMVLFALGILGAIVSVNQPSLPTGPAQINPDEMDYSGLVLLTKTVKAANDKITGRITGVVHNRRDKPLRYAQITFLLYDQQSNQIGTAMANVTGLEVNGTWKFEAVSFKPFLSYKVDELTGY